MKRVEKIIDHLVGTRLTLQSAMSAKEMLDMELYNQVVGSIYRHETTEKWVRHDAKL